MFVCLPEGRSIHISILSMSAISCCIPITITRGYIGVPVSFCRVLTPQGRVHDLRLLLPGNITCISNCLNIIPLLSLLPAGTSWGDAAGAPDAFAGASDRWHLARSPGTGRNMCWKIPYFCFFFPWIPPFVDDFPSCKPTFSSGFFS